MKTILTFPLILCLAFTLPAQVELSYYLPSDIEYNPDIPTPESIIGHQIGEWHLTHDKLVYYLTELAESSDRIMMGEYARSFENRPLFHLIITSPGNHSRLEQLHQEHLLLSDPSKSANLNISQMPAVLRLGYGIHGNESSASNASVLVAYYLAAAMGSEIEKILNETIILLDPCLNPDGFNRHATWINMHKSQNLVTDDNSRGFHEVWPGGRTNHYWFDLNRDWILAQQPETIGRVKVFHDWKPNVQTDHHEMGSSSTFFFQPGIPSRTNPLTPQSTTELTRKISHYHSKALDSIGSLYFSEEVFDDFYYGKGSTYPDVNGSIGILFEQAGTRGHARQTDQGMLTFPFAIRNQITVSFSSIEATLELKEELLTHQKNFYQSAITQANSSQVKAYVFGNPYDPARTQHFIDILLIHRIKTYELKKDLNIQNKTFSAGNSYIVPLNQPQYLMIESLFKPVRFFSDSLFYDVSSWTLPYAFNLSYAPVQSVKQVETLLGNEVRETTFGKGHINGDQSHIGYLFTWDNYYSPKALYQIQTSGLRTYVATEPFTYQSDQEKQTYSCGTIFIPSIKQKLSEEEIFLKLKAIANQTGIEFYSVTTSRTIQGIDLGSGRFPSLRKPKILLFTGNGINSTQAGEIWHLLDTRYGIPVTMTEQEDLARINLHEYNIIIMPGGRYNRVDQSTINKIKEWVNLGGTIVSINTANEWLNQKELTAINFRERPEDTVSYRDYKYLDQDRSSRYITGAIFEAELDISHPIGYGYHESALPIFRIGTLVAEKAKSPYATPLRYTSDPLLSGYVSHDNYELIKNSAGIIIHSSGSGKIISFIDNPNFRAFWYGTNKLFMNAIFFGDIISGYSTR